MMDKIITDNLIIREFKIDDVRAYFKNNNEAEIRKYMLHHSHSEEDKAREEVMGFLSDYKDRKMPCHFAITKDNIVIGHIGIGESDVSDSIYEIDCAISKDYRGLGYAAEATKAFVPWCKSTFGLDKIYASAEKENISSCKSLLNEGFTLIDIKNKEERIFYVL
jgi:RimJ/RimL family protein N-acetyltransferase